MQNENIRMCEKWYNFVFVNLRHNILTAIKIYLKSKNSSEWDKIFTHAVNDFLKENVSRPHFKKV